MPRKQTARKRQTLSIQKPFGTSKLSRNGNTSPFILIYRLFCGATLATRYYYHNCFLRRFLEGFGSEGFSTD
ncbi:MAG TPA: hypothetical protein VK435_07885, partial [Thermodesulfovibrionales bacterium]|nr:hypothetical protein [Thermodesulfovibrionales bacterium]